MNEEQAKELIKGWCTCGIDNVSIDFEEDYNILNKAFKILNLNIEVEQ